MSSSGPQERGGGDEGRQVWIVPLLQEEQEKSILETRWGET